MATTSSCESYSSANLQSLMEEEQDTFRQIEVIKDFNEKSLQNIDLIRETEENASKEVEDEKNKELCLKQGCSQLETDMNVGIRDRNVISQQVVSMRKLSTNIGDVSLHNQHTLKSVAEKTQSISQLLLTQINSNTEVITYLAMCYRDLDRKEIEKADEVSMQHEQHANHILQLNTGIMTSKKQEENYTNEFSHYHNLIEETTNKNQLLLQQISESQNILSDIKSKTEEVEKRQNELLNEMQKDQEKFQAAHDEATNRLLDIQNEILKMESAHNTLHIALNNQVNHNEELLQKIKMNENAISLSQINITEVTKEIADKENEINAVDNGLRKDIQLETDELNSLNEQYARERQLVEEIERNIFSWTEKHESLRKARTDMDKEIENFQGNKTSNLKEIENMESQYAVTWTQQASLTEEVDKATLTFSVWEKQQLEIISKKTTEVTDIHAQIEKLANNEKEIENSFVQKMNTMNLESDMKTFQMKKDLEEQLIMLKTQKQSMEQEVNRNCGEEASLAVELEEINKQCTSLNEKISSLKKFKRILQLTSLDEDQFTGSSVSLNRSKSLNSNVVPYIPRRPSLFDELSGSSAEAVVMTTEQMQKYREQRKLRHQMREERKARKGATRKK
ncbi:hypothetical protein FQR65_LT10404 [Abscondita terminalis]|nr:hypothetical protein FQR65_LT10404 [Abscondita terminalis]